MKRILTENHVAADGGSKIVTVYRAAVSAVCGINRIVVKIGIVADVVKITGGSVNAGSGIAVVNKADIITDVVIPVGAVQSAESKVFESHIAD